VTTPLCQEKSNRTTWYVVEDQRVKSQIGEDVVAGTNIARTILLAATIRKVPKLI
jgi:hypothetical protein